MTAALTGKVAVVTGAANGIGKAAALKLAQEGADLGLLDRDTAGLAAAAAEISGFGRRVQVEAVDCTSRDGIVAAFAAIRAALGPVDVLLNNVGQSARENAAPFAEADLAKSPAFQSAQ